jgi:hypothetical protein
MMAQPSAVPALSFQNVVQEVVRRHFESVHVFHRAAQGFRNRLLMMTFVTSIAAAALIIVQWRIGGSGLITTTPKNAGGLESWVVLVLVMLTGAIGALLTAIPAITAIPTNPSPFNFPLQQAFLKIVLGMLTAAVGVLAIGNSGLVTTYDSLQVLLAVAVVFGASQQAVTQFLDKRAAEIVASAK